MKLDNDKIEECRADIIDYAMDVAIETAFESGESFTKHDIVVAIRVIVGVGIEVDYDVYKRDIESKIYGRIVDSGYEITSDGYKLVFSPIQAELPDDEDIFDEDNDEDEDILDLDEDEDDCSKCDGNCSCNKNTVTSTTDQKVNIPKWYCEKVLKLSPGDRVYLLICENIVFFGKDSHDALMPIWNKKTDGEIVSKTTYVVDKHGALRLRKWIFDVVGDGVEYPWLNPDVKAQYCG